jgi:hypothetical protein
VEWGSGGMGVCTISSALFPTARLLLAKQMVTKKKGEKK